MPICSDVINFDCILLEVALRTAHWGILNLQGFYLRVVPSKRNRRNRFQQEEAIAMSLRAATTFTLGFRAFYAFIPLVSTSLGE